MLDEFPLMARCLVGGSREETPILFMARRELVLDVLLRGDALEVLLDRSKGKVGTTIHL